MQERRTYIRYKIEGTVNLSMGEGASGSIKADLVDICSRGFSAYAHEAIAVGAEVDFELSVKSWGKPIAGRGIVKYVKEVKRVDASAFRVGINFIDTDQSAIGCIIRQIVEDICARVKKKHSKGT